VGTKPTDCAIILLIKRLLSVEKTHGRRLDSNLLVGKNAFQKAFFPTSPQMQNSSASLYISLQNNRTIPIYYNL
jgi:hypothetical protein